MTVFYCNNENCTNYNKKIYVNKFKTFIEDLLAVYRDENNDIIVCKECKSELLIEYQNKGLCTNIGKFNSYPEQKKKEVLLKRAKNAYKKSGEAELKRIKQKEAIKKYIDYHGN